MTKNRKPLLDIGPIRGLLKAGEIALNNVQMSVEAFKEKRKRLLADTSRSPGYTNDMVAIALNNAYAEISPHRQTLVDLASTAASMREEVADRLLLLSKVRFSEDDATDAMMAMRVMLELDRTPANLIEKAAKTAAENGNFALVYHCALAAKKLPPDTCNVDLEGLPLPEQSEAMAALDRLPTLSAMADLSINEISATPKFGADRLAMARAAMPGSHAHPA